MCDYTIIQVPIWFPYYLEIRSDIHIVALLTCWMLMPEKQLHELKAVHHQIIFHVKPPRNIVDSLLSGVTLLSCDKLLFFLSIMLKCLEVSPNMS